jgi:acyl carrier protein
MNYEEFLNELHVVFEADSRTIRGDQRLEDIPGWDSLTFLGLIAMVDERYGICLSPKQVLACSTVNGLFDMVSGDLVRRAA